jgi:hypothetical protein
MPSYTKEQLVAMLAAAAADGVDIGDVKREAAAVVSAAEQAKEAESYELYHQNVVKLCGVLSCSDPVKAFTQLFEAGKLVPFGKCTIDARFKGDGLSDVVVKKYSSRLASNPTANGGGSRAAASFKIAVYPEAITYSPSGTCEDTQAKTIRSVAKLYAVDVENRDTWSKYSTAIKWALLIADHVSKGQIIKSNAGTGLSTEGADVKLTNGTTVLLTDWLTEQVGKYQAYQATQVK